MSDLNSILISISKWNKTLNFLSILAACEYSSINQIIVCFEIGSIFGDNTELDLHPLSVCPLRSDGKWDKSNAISVERLDEEI